jgi:hypothetical protein
MPNIDRTSAGMQMVLPGCERRTLPKSSSRSDETGQGLLADRQGESRFGCKRTAQGQEAETHVMMLPVRRL